METQKSGNGSSSSTQPATTTPPSAAAPAGPPATTTGGPESFKSDLTSARLTQDFGTMAGVKKHLITVPVGKPNRQVFFRVHGDEEYHMPAAVLELKEERESYLLSPQVYQSMPGDWVPRELVTAINRQGVVFIWPVPMPGEDGRTNPWHESAREAAALAQDKWIRMAANMSLGAYEIFEALNELPDPVWPEEDFEALLRIAYKGRYITDIDHAVLRRLRGEL